MRDQGSKGWDQESGGWVLGLQPRDQGSQAVGSGSTVFLGIRDQAVPFLWDQGPKCVTILESMIRNLGPNMGSTMKQRTYFATLLMISTLFLYILKIQFIFIY